mmetsp:Transcript_71467/g.221806  ORF Transcript_71467/g.221806 Transcript_71467/m.221806 type:complete len:200 (+) Transcript_71467:579-1178(+)
MPCDLHSQGLLHEVERLYQAVAGVKVHPQGPIGQVFHVALQHSVHVWQAVLTGHLLVSDPHEAPTKLHALVLGVAVELEALHAHGRPAATCKHHAQGPALEEEDPGGALLVAELYLQPLPLLRQGRQGLAQPPQQRRVVAGGAYGRVADPQHGPAQADAAGLCVAVGLECVHLDGQLVQQLHAKGLLLKVEGPDAPARV